MALPEFEPFFYSKDKHGVYFEDRLVDGADRDTFLAQQT
jgi:hypothetical protein